MRILLNDLDQQILLHLWDARSSERQQLTIARAVRTSNPTVSCALGDLKNLGLIERLTKHEGSRGPPSIQYALTNQGKHWILVRGAVNTTPEVGKEISHRHDAFEHHRATS